MLENIIAIGVLVLIGVVLACISTYFQTRVKRKQREKILNNVLQNFFKK